MNLDFLSPVKESVLAHSVLESLHSFGNQISIHTEQEGLPDLKDVQLAIFGVQEDRNSQDNFAKTIKNWESALFGSWARAIESVPLT